MVSREIRWTLAATRDKLSIFEYWTNRNQSALYAEKLELLFNDTIKIVAIFPFAGIETNITNVRIQIVKDFKLVYRIREEYIEVLKVWDTRQDPYGFNLKGYK
ncbi:type II toxin-antitoxin system RelE/ParE family toxin [Aequorivita capsosiphonis]|uniref:type II toxin-antitoxin system RelE/ParE family toxin n=1 Tax=Aequorivita capsosiphonis TaxID=487317 RepID=UPI000401C3A1|nr:type II toxin-antitoxin system RelE/ParE family toxin [Aequorivita capsosiphonis]